MNLLGKILVLLIFIMSIFFMTFSFMVFMTQTNWKEKADAVQSDLRTAQATNNEHKATIASLKTLRASENAARTNAIALLEARLASSGQQLAKLNSELTDLRGQQAAQGAQVTGSLQTLQTERAKVETLRDAMKTAQSERDQMFAEVVDLKNKVLELETVRQRLSDRESALLDQNSRMMAILRANDLSEHENIAGVPPRVNGRISKVDANNKYVVMSIGSDDGMRQGYQLDVHRGQKYVSRVEISKTYPDRSIARVIDEFRKDAVRSGDSVRTR